MAGGFFVESEGMTADEAFTAIQRNVRKMDYVVISETRDTLRILIQKRIQELKLSVRSFGAKYPDHWWTRYARERVAELEAVEVQERLTPRYVAELLLSIDDWRVDEPGDAAGCIDLTPKIRGKRKPKRFLFFGRKGDYIFNDQRQGLRRRPR